MIPFISQLDMLYVAGVVAGLAGVGGGLFLLARQQRPATRPLAVAAEVEVHAAPATAEPASNVAAV
ncbi:MAG TPA: hypothetical protein VF533_01195 [Solirubrobacteraceae bacterium]|jgi:hypothetical protein